MRKVWSDERKFQIWLEIEVLACEAMAELRQIPKKDAAEIRKRARFSIPEIARGGSAVAFPDKSTIPHIAPAIGKPKFN